MSLTINKRKRKFEDDTNLIDIIKGTEIKEKAFKLLKNSKLFSHLVETENHTVDLDANDLENDSQTEEGEDKSESKLILKDENLRKFYEDQLSETEKEKHFPSLFQIDNLFAEKENGKIKFSNGIYFGNDQKELFSLSTNIDLWEELIQRLMESIEDKEYKEKLKNYLNVNKLNLIID